MNNIQHLFEYWKEIMDKPNAKLLPERSRKIKARLKEGYSVEDIEKAIQGCSLSPFHMGANESGTIYTDIGLICRNGTKLEQFISIWEKGSGRISGTGVIQYTGTFEENNTA